MTIKATNIPSTAEVDNETIEISPDGKLRVKDRGITASKLNIPANVIVQQVNIYGWGTASTTYATVRSITISNYQNYSKILVFIVVGSYRTVSHYCYYRIKVGSWVSNEVYFQMSGDQFKSPTTLVFTISTKDMETNVVEIQSKTNDANNSSWFIAYAVLGV